MDGIEYDWYPDEKPVIAGVSPEKKQLFSELREI